MIFHALIFFLIYYQIVVILSFCQHHWQKKKICGQRGVILRGKKTKQQFPSQVFKSSEQNVPLSCPSKWVTLHV